MRMSTLLLLLAGTAHGQVMTQQVDLGDPIEIRAEALGEEGAKGLWISNYAAQTRQYEGNKVLCFWPKREGSYRFTLVSGVPGGELKQTVYYITVGKPGPDDEPEPDDPPEPPKPKFPDEKLGLSSLVYEAARGLSDAKDTGTKLALNHRGYGSRLKSTATPAVIDVLGELKNANNKSFAASPNAEAWKTVLAEDVARVLFKKFDDPDTVDRKEFGDALLEIAVGFEALK